MRPLMPSCRAKFVVTTSSHFRFNIANSSFSKGILTLGRPIPRPLGAHLFCFFAFKTHNRYTFSKAFRSVKQRLIEFALAFAAFYERVLDAYVGKHQPVAGWGAQVHETTYASSAVRKMVRLLVVQESPAPQILQVLGGNHVHRIIFPCVCNPEISQQDYDNDNEDCKYCIE